MNRPATVVTIASIAVLSAAGGILGANALGEDQPQGPPTGALSFDFRAGPVAGDNPARGSKTGGAPKPGDILTVRGPISQNGKKVGVADGTLTFEGDEPTFVVVFKFNNGSDLIDEGAATSKGPTSSAVVGGTGVYAGARGELVETLKDSKKQIYRETVRFIP
jgi:hypothetical protein